MTKVALPNFLKNFKLKMGIAFKGQPAEDTRPKQAAFCPCHSAAGFTYHICGITEEEGQRVDLLSIVHRNSAPLKSAREAALKGNVRWHHDKYVQMYSPFVTTGVSQVEVYYDKLGLGMIGNVTVIGGAKSTEK